MTRLSIPSGAFISTSWGPGLAGDLRVWQKDLEKTGIKLIVGKIEHLRSLMATHGLATQTSGYGSRLWQLSHLLEKWMLRHLSERRRMSELTGARAARRYYHLVNNEVFFINSPIERVTALYKAYREHPRLGLAASNELSLGVFAPPLGPSRSLGQSGAGRNVYVQACLYVEHRARLALLKAAVDHLSTANRSDLFTVIMECTQPVSFQEGLHWLQRQPSYLWYPLLWQVFLWTWGGFWLTCHAGREYGLLADQSGVPKKEIPAALECFDRFFPREDGWFTRHAEGRISALRLVPVQFRGVGALNAYLRHPRAEKTILDSGELANTLKAWIRTLPRDITSGL